MSKNRTKSKIKAKSQVTVILGLLLLATVLSLSPVLGSSTMMQNYKQTNLVSDIPGMAKFTDPNLVNPWGIARSPISPWWVSDNGKGVSTVYNGTGVPFPPGNPLIVTVPAGMAKSTPTGIISNDGYGFWVRPGIAARFIFVTEDGTISAWNQSVNLHKAILKVNNSKNAVYKGATIAIKDGKKYLYVANFKTGSVDVFNTSFKRVAMPKNSFKDSKIPPGYAPFDVQKVQSKIVVTFAKQDADKHDEVDGPGLGYVDLFYPNGTLFMRLQHGTYMNAPWGVTHAPNNFGKFGGRLLVGNFGDGRIMAFNGTGAFKGYLTRTVIPGTMKSVPISIKGLWGLNFGNGANAGLANSLYFAAGINKEAHGLFGMIRAS